MNRLSAGGAALHAIDGRVPWQHRPDAHAAQALARELELLADAAG